MSATLAKCTFECKDVRPEDFEGRHTLYGEPVCDWCAHLLAHDPDCCGMQKVSLVKNLSDWKYFRNDDEPLTEYELAWRRWRNGARVSAEWAYYLLNNDLGELREFYRHG